MKQLIVSLICVWAVTHSPAAESLYLPNTLPANTNVVASLNFAKVKQQQPIKELEKLHGHKYNQIKTFLKTGIGFDIDKITHACLFGPSFDESVVIFKGDFDLYQIGSAAMNNQQFEMVKRAGCNMAILLPDKGVQKVNMAAIFDKNTIAFGKTAYVEAFLKARQDPKSQLDAAQMKKVASFFKDNADLKAVLLKEPIDADDGMKNIFKHVDNLAIQFNIDSELKGCLTAEAKTEKKAEAIKNLALGFLQLFLGEPDQNPLLNILKTEALKHLKVDQSGKQVSIQTKLSKPLLDQIIMMTAIFSVPKPKDGEQ